MLPLKPARGLRAIDHLRGLLAVGVFAAGTVFATGAMAVNPVCGDAIRITPGDTLLRVAAACDTTVPALLAANPAITRPNQLFVGQLVYMPGRNSAAPVYRPPVSAPPAGQNWGQISPCGATVQVRSGDSFSRIASRCGVSFAQLRAANPQLRDPNLIYAGMELRLPSPALFRPLQPSVPPAVPQSLRVSGTITGEGRTCQAMRGDDGTLYTFAGNATRPLRPGDRVELRGTRAVNSVCQQGVTITASQIILLEAEHAAGFEITGTITREGVTCTALRGDDGRLYTIAGDLAGFQPGDRVRVTGDLAQMSFCQQGTTVNLRAIRSAF